MEEVYFWRAITGRHLLEHCHRFVGIVALADCDIFNPTLHSLQDAVQDELNHMPLNEGGLLSQAMVERGVVAHSIYDAFIKRVTRLRLPVYGS